LTFYLERKHADTPAPVQSGEICEVTLVAENFTNFAAFSGARRNDLTGTLDFIAAYIIMSRF
jgi:hypothetical protein